MSYVLIKYRDDCKHCRFAVFVNGYDETGNFVRIVACAGGAYKCRIKRIDCVGNDHQLDCENRKEGR